MSKLRRGFSCAPRTRSLLCVFPKTHITGAFCTKIQSASSSFATSKLRTRLLVWHKISSAICYSLLAHLADTFAPNSHNGLLIYESKLRRGFSCAPKIRSLLCVFTFQRTTLINASLRRLRTRLLVWFKISSAICYSLLAHLCVSSPQIATTASSFTLSKLRRGFSCAPCPPPLFTGIFFDTRAAGAPTTRTSHRRRESDRLVGRGWRESQSR